MRRILVCAAVLLAAIELWAAPVDMKTAQSKAQRFVQQQSYNGRLAAPLAGEMKLAHAEMNSKMLDRAVYYIFNSDNGFVIVSGDDRAEEILGYGDAPLDIRNIPCNMKGWLDTYKEQLEYLQANENLQVRTPVRVTAPLQTASVEPLLTCNWDQTAPYYDQCIINGYQCLTGCPATSAAQVFYYWKYPNFETPQVPGYKCSLSTSSWGGGSQVNVAPLPPVTFDWNNMQDNYGVLYPYTPEQGEAVATLMRYVGQAEHMAYGVVSAGSGIDADSVILIANAFKFFGYDEETIRAVKKTSAYSGGTTLYSDEEWATMIQEELKEGRPIVYCAVSYGGGHAFNVDGYDAVSNKYHINWGWSGDSNNYFALNAFIGDGLNFNQYQQMVIGIEPPVVAPRLRSNANALSMACYKNQTATSQFKVTGRNLEGDVTLMINDENDVFSVDMSAVAPDEEGKVSQVITVTYAPRAEGEYAANLILSTPGAEDIMIALEGVSVYELYRPVMQVIDDESVTNHSFRADWIDNTPEENVTSYTLEVKNKPDIFFFTEADWSDVPADNDNHADDAADYMPEGWTFTGSLLYLDGGFLSPGRNSIINVQFDMASYDKVSVIVTAKAYTKGAGTTLTIATDAQSQTLTLAKALNTYLVVLNMGSRNNVTFTAGYYPEIQSIRLYGGEVTDINNIPEDEEPLLVIDGITGSKSYTVNGLTAGGDYLYRVKSFYVNGTESAWSNSREVVLKQGETMCGDVDGDGTVTITDATLLIDAVLSGDFSEIDTAAADCNNDGAINIEDVTKMIGYLLEGTW